MTATATARPIVEAIGAIYGVGSRLAAYMDELVDSMKASSNQTVARSGRVIESAKFGFGIGFITPVAIVALGQALLGHPFVAAYTVVASPLSPVALTCAAVGAIYYGWSALSDEERNGIIERLREGLQIGAELIKAIANFVVTTIKELLSEENIAEFKRFVGDAASAFGRTLADVTRSIKDRAGAAYDYVADKLHREPEQLDASKLPRLINPVVPNEGDK